MLPVRPPPALEDALAGLETTCQGRSNATVRVGLADGRTVEGGLIGASPGHVAVAVAVTTDGGESSTVQRLVAAEIRSLELSVPHRPREWALAAVSVVGVTSVLVGLSAIPMVGALDLDLVGIFRVLFVVVVGLGSVLLARTSLGRWLTRWRVLYRNVEG